MYDRDHIEDEDAYQEIAEGDFDYDSETELDFGWVNSISEPTEGLYESFDSSLTDGLDEPETDPFIADLMEESPDDAATQARVDFDFEQFYVGESCSDDGEGNSDGE